MKTVYRKPRARVSVAHHIYPLSHLRAAHTPAKQFQIAHGRVVVKTIGNKRLLVEPLGIGEHLLRESYHVVEVKAPLALRH
jgi:hypothetical protein